MNLAPVRGETLRYAQSDVVGRSGWRDRLYVILKSVATKNLVPARVRFFASLRMTADGGEILRFAQNDG